MSRITLTTLDTSASRTRAALALTAVCSAVAALFALSNAAQAATVAAPAAAQPFRVVATTRHQVRTTITIKSSDFSLETTPEHPFFVLQRGFVRAEKLQPGDRLRRPDGSEVEVGSVHRRARNQTPVYNLSVETAHTYYVGADPVLAHNVLACTATLSSGASGASKVNFGRTPQALHSQLRGMVAPRASLSRAEQRSTGWDAAARSWKLDASDTEMFVTKLQRLEQKFGVTPMTAGGRSSFFKIAGDTYADVSKIDKRDFMDFNIQLGRIFYWWKDRLPDRGSITDENFFPHGNPLPNLPKNQRYLPLFAAPVPDDAIASAQELKERLTPLQYQVLRNYTGSKSDWLREGQRMSPNRERDMLERGFSRSWVTEKKKDGETMMSVHSALKPQSVALWRLARDYQGKTTTALENHLTSGYAVALDSGEYRGATMSASRSPRVAGLHGSREYPLMRIYAADANSIENASRIESEQEFILSPQSRYRIIEKQVVLARDGSPTGTVERNIYFVLDKNNPIDKAFAQLGLSRSASQKDLDNAYRKMFRQNQPDKKRGSLEKVESINRARDIVQKALDATPSE